VAIVAEGKRGKIFLPPTAEHEAIAEFDDQSVREARSTFLAGSLPTRAEITGGVCTAYGLSTWGHLFSARQLTALLILSDLIGAVFSDVVRDAGDAGLGNEERRAYASSITTFLALALDRCADFNNVLCRWNPSNEKVMNLFGRQALPMVWDCGEANLLGDSVGAWTTCLEHEADCIEVMTGGGGGRVGRAYQIDAASDVNGLQQLLVSTDPPYYDNISYATLSDFFYIWLRRTVGDLHPELFNTVLTPKSGELIASPDRFDGSREAAKEHFESGFRRAFTALLKRMDPRFPLTVYYAFKQDDEAAEEERDHERDRRDGRVDRTTGWETLLEALISSGFEITATWPVRASQKWRMVSMGTNALASYIVLACRPRPADALPATRREFMAALRPELIEALSYLQRANIAPVDLAQAAIGPGMAVYTRYTGVLEASGRALSVREALALINQTLDESFSDQEGDFDVDSRWAVAWFEHSGFGEGDFGVAETLSKAKNTSVGSMAETGILESKRGKVRLLRAGELPADWDPTTDPRVTAWQMVHQLIRALEARGESAAAALVAKLGSKAEIARELAYRLYTISEREKRAREALSYNALVQSWPEIVRLASVATVPASQGHLL
jgi:putative DNA methylase